MIKLNIIFTWLEDQEGVGRDTDKNGELQNSFGDINQELLTEESGSNVPENFSIAHFIK